MPSVYWQNKSEAQLAVYQQSQVGNTCAAHAIASALNLAFNLNLDGCALGETAYANWWRLWSNPFHAGIPPYAQVNLLHHLAKQHQLALQTHYFSSDPQNWLGILPQPDQLLLVTLYWLARPAFLAEKLTDWKYPRITYGRSDSNYNNPDGIIITGHTMLLVAYDSQHTTYSGEVRPWGFINSWVSGGNYLFWMAQDDILRFPREVVKLTLHNP